MMKLVGMTIGLLAASHPVAAQTSASEKEVRAVEEQRYKAMIGADFPTLEKVLADDLVYVHSSGVVDDKNSYFAPLRSGSVRYKKISPEDTRVRITGTLAVVTGRSSIELERDGKPQAFRLRFTAVYEKSAPGWRLVSWQATRLPES